MVLLFGSCCYLYDDSPTVHSHQTSAILFFFFFFYHLHHIELTRVGWKMLTFKLDLYMLRLRFLSSVFMILSICVSAFVLSFDEKLLNVK